MIDLIDFCIFSKILQIAFTDGLLTDTHALMLEMLPHLKTLILIQNCIDADMIGKTWQNIEI